MNGLARLAIQVGHSGWPFYKRNNIFPKSRFPVISGTWTSLFLAPLPPLPLRGQTRPSLILQLKSNIFSSSIQHCTETRSTKDILTIIVLNKFWQTWWLNVLFRFTQCTKVSIDDSFCILLYIYKTHCGYWNNLLLANISLFAEWQGCQMMILKALLVRMTN